MGYEQLSLDTITIHAQTPDSEIDSKSDLPTAAYQGIPRSLDTTLNLTSRVVIINCPMWSPTDHCLNIYQPFLLNLNIQ